MLAVRVIHSLMDGVSQGPIIQRFLSPFLLLLFIIYPFLQDRLT